MIWTELSAVPHTKPLRLVRCLCTLANLIQHGCLFSGLSPGLVIFIRSAGTSTGSIAPSLAILSMEIDRTTSEIIDGSNEHWVL